MDLRRIVLTLAVLIAVAAGSSAQGQSCQQGGRYSGCGLCSMFYNIIYDPGFDSSSCWSFDSGAGQYTSDGACHWWSDTHGRITGNTNGWKSIYQFTQARPGGDGFYFSYDLEIDDPNATVEVWIGVYPAQWTLADTRSGLTCGTFGQSLGNHPEWVNQPLMVVISGNIPSSGGTIKVDQVALDQLTAQ